MKSIFSQDQFVECSLLRSLAAPVVGLVFLSALAFNQSASAQNKDPCGLKIDDPWVRGTVVGQGETGAFMTLTAEQPCKLVGVSSTVAGIAQVHEMKTDHLVMTMREMPNGLILPAGKSVQLKPGGYHLMLMKLNKTLTSKQDVGLTLKVVNTQTNQEGSIEFKALVRDLGSIHNAHMDHDHDMK